MKIKSVMSWSIVIHYEHMHADEIDRLMAVHFQS